MRREPLELLRDELAAEREAVLVTIVAFRGSVPRKDKPSMLFCADGRRAGTVGGGCVDGFAEALARRVMAEGGSERLACELDGDEAEDAGLVCGGSLELEAVRHEPGPEAIAAVDALLADPSRRTPRLIVFGGGHVGLAAARFADQVGFAVSVVDEREAYANAERFPFAEACLAGPPARAGELPPPGEKDAVLVATRGHREDLEAMDWACRSGAGWIGLLGSRRKKAMLLEALAARGAPVASLGGRWHSPVGLDIGALSAEEIALAAVAQLVAFRRGRL